MTLADLLAHLRTVAVEYRREGRSCCAQQAEQYATRLAEAIERESAVPKIIDPNEWVIPKRAPLGLRWLWRRIGRWFA